ncbi:hypothetical protein Tco_0033248 [Tanacetum coccineum]
MVNATKDNFDEDALVKFQKLLLDAEKPLYEGCPDFTKLSAIVKLLNLKGKYIASDKFFTELLGLIKKMLPAGYKKIHVCINNCLLYWKDDKDLTACRTCGISRWKVDNKTHKVYENIPTKNVAESLVGTLLHVPGKTKDGVCKCSIGSAELGPKQRCLLCKEEDKQNYPPAVTHLTNAGKIRLL